MRDWLKKVSLVGVILAFLSGCGSDRADVSGKITYKGQPVIFGKVTFLGIDEKPVHGTINPDGSYEVKKVLAGTNRYGVVSPNPDPPGAPPPKNGKPRERTVDPGRWFAIPDELSDPRKTNLTVEVKPGVNSYDIELK